MLATSIKQINEWGAARCITTNGTLEGQWFKLISEIGELADNLAKKKDITDDVGDIFVVLCMIAGVENISIEKAFELSVPVGGQDADFLGQMLIVAGRLRFSALCDVSSLGDMINCLRGISYAHNLRFDECVGFAYDQIKDRKGALTKDGVFIKES